MDVNETLDMLGASGNFRTIPDDTLTENVVDLSSNDYLGMAVDMNLRHRFLEQMTTERLEMTSSASRLLAASQHSYNRLERLLSDSYGGTQVLLFNSGYHANTGLVSALADRSTLIVADKLVHASIIDGIKLSGAPFERFRHNDYEHLKRILEAKAAQYANALIIVESVYSMDGDRANLQQIVDIKHHFANALLYVDEAHGVGVLGPGGLGECARVGVLDNVDILVGTLGKALASTGAFAVLQGRLRDFMVNRARSFIFSTAFPPVCAEWTCLTWQRMLEGDDLRSRLQKLAAALAAVIPGGEPSHIRPFIVGDAARAVALSAKLREAGFKVLPIRTPTVPPGTERLRFSLSAAIDNSDIERLGTVFNQLTSQQ